MALKPMETLIIGNNPYEIVDTVARVNITELQNKIDNANSSPLINATIKHHTEEFVDLSEVEF